MSFSNHLGVEKIIETDFKKTSSIKLNFQLTEEIFTEFFEARKEEITTFNFNKFSYVLSIFDPKENRVLKLVQ